MQLIRCTQKLLKEMGLQKYELNATEPTFSYLGSWHANLLHIDGKKCILFVNDRTLFNFIVPNVKRQEIKNLSRIFYENLKYALSFDETLVKVQEKILREYTEVNYSITNSKKVLGYMNDLAFHYKHSILTEGGIHSALIPSIIIKLNHITCQWACLSTSIRVKR